MIANTIDEVIDQLEVIIQNSIIDQSPLGYFAALYKKVTVNVKNKLGQNYFDDDQRMEQLDVVFANRYLRAYADYTNGNSITKSWERTFVASQNKKLIVLQHLLLGMDAHINLDLGIAAAQITTPATLQDLESDFNKINEILASLIDDVQNDLASIWPTLLKILKWAKSVDDFLVNFSMNLARDGAWKFANELALAKASKQGQVLILDRDEKISKLSNLITDHGIIGRIIFAIIRWGEHGTVSDKVKALSNYNPLT